MRLLTTLIMLAMATLAFAQDAAAPSAGPALTALGCGSPAGAWAVVEIDQSALRPAGAPATSWRLYHLGTLLPIGSAYNVTALESCPTAMTAVDSMVYLVFEPLRNAPPGAMRSVRSVTAIALDTPIPYAYEPAARLAVHASLPSPEEGGLEGFARGRVGPVALLRPSAERKSSPDTGLDLRPRLLELTTDDWRDAPLPEALDEHADWRLLSADGDVCIAEVPVSGEAARLWRPARSGEKNEISSWSSSPIALSPADGPVASTTIGLVTASRTSGGVVALRLVREADTVRLAEVAGVGAGFTMAPGGDVLNLVWLEGEPHPRLHVAVVSAVTGEVLQSGPSTPTLPISTDDIRFLGLVLTLVVLTVLVFVLRPEASKKLISLPEAFALAPPDRRLWAALVDLAIPLLVVSVISGDAVFTILAAPFRAQSPAEIWPFAATFAGLLCIGTLGEWLFSTTPGKALLRLRVISVTGARLTLWQAFSRNLLKVVCPPLTLLAFIEASRRHPADALAGAVVITRRREERA